MNKMKEETLLMLLPYVDIYNKRINGVSNYNIVKAAAEQFSRVVVINPYIGDSFIFSDRYEDNIEVYYHDSSIGSFDNLLEAVNEKIMLKDVAFDKIYADGCYPAGAVGVSLKENIKDVHNIHIPLITHCDMWFVNDMSSTYYNHKFECLKVLNRSDKLITQHRAVYDAIMSMSHSYYDKLKLVKVYSSSLTGEKISNEEKVIALYNYYITNDAVDKFVEIAAEFLKTHRDGVKFLIKGGILNERYVYERIKAYHITPYFTVENGITVKDVIETPTKIDILINITSNTLDGSYNREGAMNDIMIDSMRYGVVMLTDDRYHRDIGIGVYFKDIAGAVSSLNDIMNDEEIAKKSKSIINTFIKSDSYGLNIKGVLR